MNNKVHIILTLFVCLFVFQAGSLYAGSPASEYEMKAAYIHKILQFVQLPETKRTDDGGKTLKIVHVGVSDKDVLMSFKKVIGDKKILQHKEPYKIAVKYFDVRQLLDKNAKPELDVLFIKDTGKRYPREIRGAFVKNHILTFGETRGFLESGGIVSFVIVKRKLQFEINKGMAEQSGIRIRSQLLKLAKRTIDKKS